MPGNGEDTPGSWSDSRVFDKQDVVVMDMPVEGFEGYVPPVASSSKFGFAWPTDPHVPPSASDTSTEHEPETESPIEAAFPSEDREGTPKPDKSPIPSLARAYSMPLPSQLGHLRNPHKHIPLSSSLSSTSIAETPAFSQFHELSLELADSVQMIIQTLLQVSPPQLLDPAKEQFSACSLSVPTPSMSAMFTSMKNLNYISANMAALCTEPEALLPDIPQPKPAHNDFDVAEMLQSVGDALGGASAQAGVDIIIFHGNVELKHMPVKGDESGISYALSHVIRQVISTARRGDCIEIGLYVTPISRQTEAEDMFNGKATTTESMRCVFDIAHKFVGDGGEVPIEYSPSSSSTQQLSRPIPSLSTLLLRRLLHQIGGTLAADLPPKTFPYGRTCELVLTLEPGVPSLDTTPNTLTPDDPAYQLFSTVKASSTEPTLDELAQFTETLRGKKVTLCASSKGSFAHHLTSYLTAWGLDVSHVGLENGTDGHAEIAGVLQTTLTSPTPPVQTSTYGVMPEAPSPTTTKMDEEPPSFIFIDDDINVLRERLQAARTLPAYPLHLNGNFRKRPSLAANHRPQSSPHVARAMGTALPPLSTIQHPSVVIVHFTSLANYKLVKDVIQTVLSAPGTKVIIPEVMIIPKPAGPRRFLTALHTAVTKPTVDAFFAPIATSPMTPSLHATSFFNFANGSDASPPASNRSDGGGSGNARDRPSGSRSNSDRSARSPKEGALDHHNHPLPSPLGMTDGTEYFADQNPPSTMRPGGSASSGLMIQSPDGQPAGIFFHPKGKTSRTSSGGSGGGGGGVTMERDTNKALLIIPSRASGSGRRSMSPPPVDHAVPKSHSFSSLHSASAAGGSGGSPRTQDLDSTPRMVSRRTGSGGQQRHSEGSSPVETMAKRVVTPPTSPLFENAHATGSGSNSPAGVAPVRRAMRRATVDVKTPQTPGVPVAPVKKKKGKGTDGIIVPPISVLVVDDNPINQTILSTFMKKHAIKYDVANNGYEAVEKWKTGGFHLILMDIQMPIMNGIDATKEIRHLEKVNDSGYIQSVRTPSSEGSGSASPSLFDDRSGSLAERPRASSSVIIVALTASSLQADRVAALAAGCNDFLTKPVSLKWLNSKIIEWGSIKALQMYLPRTVVPQVPASVLATQSAQTKKVAMALHVPPGRATPPSRAVSPGRPAKPPMPLSIEADAEPLLSVPDTIAAMAPTFSLTEPTPPPPGALEEDFPATEDLPSDKELAEAQEVFDKAPNGTSHPMVDDPRVPSAAATPPEDQEPDEPTAA